MMNAINVTIDHYGHVGVRVAPPADPHGCLRLERADYLEMARRALEQLPVGGHVPRPVPSIADDIEARVEQQLQHIERSGDVIAEISDDGTGAGCVASVVYAGTGRPVPRAADEGGSHRGGGNYPHWAAAHEAEARALRTGQPVRRVGYTSEDLTERP